MPAQDGYTAVAAAPPMGMHDAPDEAVTTAASVYDQPLQTFDDRLSGLARTQPDRAGYAASLPPVSEPLTVSRPFPHDDDCTPGREVYILPVGATEDPDTIASVPMVMDQGATWQTGSLLPPYPLVYYLGGKRRLLNGEDDGDERERSEHSLLEDIEAGPRNSALRPSWAKLNYNLPAGFGGQFPTWVWPFRPRGSRKTLSGGLDVMESPRSPPLDCPVHFYLVFEYLVVVRYLELERGCDLGLQLVLDLVVSRGVGRSENSTCGGWT
ncbi:hypothetical protein PsorP6_017424 [Peronosclerospora sorghi]|uniref:Uncharacterized protein n=1 Tax=Peronosclerospora sorghi TaxID=230839 RepID=A0ACC0WKY3_9STRA|nr:hypothetical protein PsorP6_017424 [Peronosclerospora sorghi]